MCFSRQDYKVDSLCLVCVSPATAVEGSSHVPLISVTEFVGSMAMDITSHLMIRGLTSAETVNTHSFR